MLTRLFSRRSCIGVVGSPLRHISSSAVSEISSALNQLKEQLGKEVRLFVSSTKEVELHALSSNSSAWEIVLKGTELKEIHSLVKSTTGNTLMTPDDNLSTSFSSPSLSISPALPLRPSGSNRTNGTGSPMTERGGCTHFISPLTNVVFDWTTAQQDLRVEASERIQKKFPRLAIHTMHSRAADLQGQQSHTISVELRPISSSSFSTRDSNSPPLSEEELDALKRFRGESVGFGFRGTLRRALQAAFLQLGETFPSSSSVAEEEESEGMTAGEKQANPAAPATSVLGLYASILHRCAASASEGEMEVSWENEDRTVCVVRQQGGKTVSTGRHARSPLMALLTALEAAAVALDATASDEVKAKIEHSNLYVLLPERSVNVKHVLEKILQFYLGISSSSALSVEVSSHDGLFTAEVKVLVPLQAMRLASSDCSLVLCRVSGRSKKHAKELALIKSVEKHFPHIFEEQIAFHAEVQRMLSSGKASETGEVPPHISRGLQCQLEWACKKEGLSCSIGCARVALQCANDHSLSEATEADVGEPPSASNGARILTSWRTTVALHPLSDTKSLTPIFSCVVPDMRKGRSTQKAIATVIAQKFGGICKEAVEYAVSQRLINSDGTPVITEKVVDPFSAEAIVSKEVTEFQTDPLLRELAFTPYQYVKGNDPPDSLTLMDLYRKWGDGFAKIKYHNSPCARVHEKIVLGVEEWEPAVATLTAALESEDGSVLEQLEYSTAFHKQPLRALLLCYEKLIENYSESPNEEGRNNTEKQEENGGGVRLLTQEEKLLEEKRRDFMSRLPATLPGALPLSTIAQLVMNLYGCAMIMNAVSENSRSVVVVRLYSQSRDLVEEEGVSSVPSHASSLLTDDNLLLGKGEGIDLPYAVLACCRDIWKNHFKAFKSAFEEGDPPILSSFEVFIDASSKAKELLQSVVEEIKLSLPCGTTCQGDVTVQFASPVAKPPMTLMFGVIAGGEKKVNLEQASGTDLVTLLQEVCDCISKETHFGFSPPKRILELNLSHFQRLSILLTQFLGLPIHCEVLRWEGEWCCRLSLRMNSKANEFTNNHKEQHISSSSLSTPSHHPLLYRSIMWCLCTCFASKKNDAVEAASIFLIRRYFPNIFTDLSPSNAIVSVSESNTTLGSYFFTI